MLDYCLARFETEILIPRFKYNSRAAYKSDILQCLNFLREQAVTDMQMLTQEHLRQFIMFLINQGSAKATLVRKLASCRLFLDFCTKEGLTAVRYKNIFRKKFEAPFIKYDESLEQLAIITDLLQNGLSATEITNLKKSDVNFVTKEIIIQKNNATKSIKIPPHCLEKLQKYYQLQQGDHLFTIKPAALKSLIKKSYKKPQKIPDFLRSSPTNNLDVIDEVQQWYIKKHPRA